MKYLSSYLEAPQKQLYTEVGAIYAFGNKQLKESIRKGVRYGHLGHNLFCPTCNIPYLRKRQIEIWDNAIKQDIAENGIKGIVMRELFNHECQITMDPTDAIEAVQSHGITKQQVLEVWPKFWRECVDNDYF